MLTRGYERLRVCCGVFAGAQEFDMKLNELIKLDGWLMEQGCLSFIS
jgi:hypothetical protein